MKYLHTMVRVSNLEQSLDFYCKKLGLKEVRRKDFAEARFSLIFLKADGDDGPELELTFNWDSQSYDNGRNFGHLAYEVEDIYDYCQKLIDEGVIINRPPRDGRMAFVRSPDGISIEILQQGEALEICKPWDEMPNVGEW